MNDSRIYVQPRRRDSTSDESLYKFERLRCNSAPQLCFREAFVLQHNIIPDRNRIQEIDLDSASASSASSSGPKNNNDHHELYDNNKENDCTKKEELNPIDDDNDDDDDDNDDDDEL